ncbi:MAG: hypothetical protein HYS13_09165 [Planctomycetia bacterium]|nr:hypothetical protein [Planctomycetia bacterium]
MMWRWFPLLAAIEPQPLWKRLDPVTRARLLMALLALVILLLAIVVFIVMGARLVRRLGKVSRRPLPRKPWYEVRPTEDAEPSDGADLKPDDPPEEQRDP